MINVDSNWQTLETRRHLSATLDYDGTLIVQGTSRDDVIRVVLDDLTSRPGFAKHEVYAVRVNGKTTVIDADVVERIEIDARGGDDEVRVAHSSHGRGFGRGNDFGPVEIPVTLRGGDGDDVLIGGDADDLLVGGGGRDSLAGND